MLGLPVPAAALAVGVIAAVMAAFATLRSFAAVGRPVGRWPLWASASAGVLGCLLVAAMQAWGCQQTEEVRPTPLWNDLRVLYHIVLMVLLIAATATDLDSYYIPDNITVTGMVIGLSAAFVAGDLQTAHVWVDWNEAIPQIRGPYLPAWLSSHPHWHGLAWSAAGLLVGMTLTWGTRGLASTMMGTEAMGFGDVMLMGMVGSFLGWQPTVVAFLLAPLCAVTIGLAVRLLGGKSYIPYGPYLAAGSLIVLFAWRWIWMAEIPLYAAAGPNDREGLFAVRRLFGDWVSLLALVGLMAVSLPLLLGLVRLYRLIPGRVATEERAAGDD